MRFLVCSDIHGCIQNFEEALSRVFGEDIDGVIISGDLEVSINEIYDIIDDISQGEILRQNTHIVKGNCDSYILRDVASVEVFDCCGHKIFLTHGHMFGVPRRNDIYMAASKEGCDIAIFGHSHVAEDSMEDEVRFINPGSLKSNRYGSSYPTYMVLDITKEEVTVEIFEV